ncbi:MAG: VWA domain-containing protein [Alphaproteobacteria bacterium]|nr:VWA domain-containing protein [Alphaproteobacteria bacterium]
MVRPLSLLLATLAVVSGCQEPNILLNNVGRGKGDAPPLSTPRKTDVIRQTTVPEVDILWVVDNSCSMSDEQQALGTNFFAFINYFLDSGLDWHIGVVSTDMDAGGHSGKLRKALGFSYLTPEVNDPISLFRTMVNLGTDGSATEQGIDAAYAALATPSSTLAAANAGFYRDDAALHIVVISDEEDQSTRIELNEFIDYLRTLKRDADIPVTFSSIVGIPGKACGGLDWTPGSRYLNVTSAVGGIAFDICEQDWQPVLDQLGLQAAGLRDEYFLSEVPVPGTISVWLDDQGQRWEGIDLDTKPPKPTLAQVCDKRHEHTRCFGFVYDSQRNSIEMPDFIPPALSDVSIDYELLREQQPGLDEDEVASE